MGGGTWADQPRMSRKEKVFYIVVIVLLVILGLLGVLDNSYDLGNTTSAIVVKEYHG